MQFKKNKEKLFLSFLISLFLVNLVFAQQVATRTIEDLANVVIRVINVIISIFWAIVVAFGLYTAFLYLNARGEADKVKKAKQTLTYFIIAIAVMVSITLIRNVLIDLLGGQMPTGFGPVGR